MKTRALQTIASYCGYFGRKECEENIHRRNGKSCNSNCPRIAKTVCDERKTDSCLAFFNTWKSNTGVGIFAMPYLLQEAGLIPGICIFIVLMIISVRCCVKLVNTVNRLYDGRRYKSLDHRQVKHIDYTEAASLVLGSWGKWATVLSLVIGNFGTCVSYLVFVKQNLRRFFPGVFNNTVEREEAYWVLILSPLMLLLTCLKNMNYLAPASVLGIVAL